MEENAKHMICINEMLIYVMHKAPHHSTPIQSQLKQ